jgi:hypothetical protein
MWAFARLQIPDERFFDLLGDRVGIKPCVGCTTRP